MSKAARYERVRVLLVSRPLRVLSIGHSYVVALNRAVMREVARDPGIDLTVAAPTFFHGDLRPIPLEPEPAGSPLKVVPIDVRWTKRVHVFHYDRAALRALLAKKFDVVHMWEEPYILAGYQIALALAKSDSRFAFWTAQNYSKRYPPPFGFFERKVLARAQGWMACADLVRETLAARGYSESTCRTINLAVDLSVFRPPTADVRAATRAELGLDGAVVGYMGRLNEDKGLDVLIAALDRIDRAKTWSFLFLGGGHYRAKIEAWARQRRIDKLKILSVPHDDIPRHLGAMDLLVAPSQTMPAWKEQFGRMLIEAFACGVPVIGSDSGEIPYVIGDAGIVVPEKDVGGWASAIERLHDDESLRTVFREKGLTRATKYSERSIALKYCDFFHWLAEQPLTAHV